MGNAVTDVKIQSEHLCNSKDQVIQKDVVFTVKKKKKLAAVVDRVLP